MHQKTRSFKHVRPLDVCWRQHFPAFWVQFWSCCRLFRLLSGVIPVSSTSTPGRSTLHCDDRTALTMCTSGHNSTRDQDSLLLHMNRERWKHQEDNALQPRSCRPWYATSPFLNNVSSWSFVLPRDCLSCHVDDQIHTHAIATSTSATSSLYHKSVISLYFLSRGTAREHPSTTLHHNSWRSCCVKGGGPGACNDDNPTFEDNQKKLVQKF